MLLEVNELAVSFGGRTAVSGIGFVVDAGQRRGLIGESGSGKSVTVLSLLGLQPATATVSGSVKLDGEELVGASAHRLAALRCSAVAMVFQESLTALNPLTRVGWQVAQPLRRHGGMSRSAAGTAAVELLAKVGLPEPERLSRAFPPQLSGGQRQRVGIAMALACRPKLLIADEPTTALDVIVQAEILTLLDDLVAEEQGPALLFVSHDLPVVARLCDTVMVMRDGHVVTQDHTETLLRDPQHPYARALVAAARATCWTDDGEPRGDGRARGAALR